MSNEKRNIFLKMTNIKMKLLGIKKTGENKFANYNYFELGDILPVLMPALVEENLFMKTQFSATEQIAKLIIFDIDDPEERIEFETFVASCSLKGAHDVQNLGAVQTYIRRYLLMTAFDIAEIDFVNSIVKPYGNQEKTLVKKPSQPAKLTEQEEEKRRLSAEAWKLIKKLPVEEQDKYISQCKKEGSIDVFKNVISVITGMLMSERPTTTQVDTKQQEQSINEKQPNKSLEEENETLKPVNNSMKHEEEIPIF